MKIRKKKKNRDNKKILPVTYIWLFENGVFMPNTLKMKSSCPLLKCRLLSGFCLLPPTPPLGRRLPETYLLLGKYRVILGWIKWNGSLALSVYPPYSLSFFWKFGSAYLSSGLIEIIYLVKQLREFYSLNNYPSLQSSRK